MLRNDSGAVHRSPPSACLVVPITSGHRDSKDVVAHSNFVARALTTAGWDVHALLCSLNRDARIESGVARRFESTGAFVISLTNVTYPSILDVSGPNQTPLLRLGDTVCHALRELHKKHRFALIEFPERGGLGFRATQAKRAGLAFADVVLLAKMHGPSAWLRHQSQRWVRRAEDLAEDFCERRSFLNADQRLVLDESACSWVESAGWNVRNDVKTFPQVPSEREISGIYKDALATTLPTTIRSSVTPLVTVGMPYYNLGNYLEEALTSLAQQTYENLDVIVINDGSMDANSRVVFDSMQVKFPQFRFLSQANAGIGATRNRALELANGTFFLPMDADNVAHPDMIKKLVAAMCYHPSAAALTCYFLAFEHDSANRLPSDGDSSFIYSYRPFGGPRVLASMWNVYGDANALFRTSALRSVGGFTTDRYVSWEDWEVFVRFANAGHVIDVVPEFLFYYRHRDSGFSRSTQNYHNHQRVLRRFFEIEQIPRDERFALWSTLVGFQRRIEQLEGRLASKKHRLADWLGGIVTRARSLLSFLQ